MDFIDKENPTTTIIIHLYQPVPLFSPLHSDWWDHFLISLIVYFDRLTSTASQALYQIKRGTWRTRIQLSNCKIWSYALNRYRFLTTSRSVSFLSLSPHLTNWITTSDAKQSFDEVALPALLIYRNQVLEGAYLRLIDDLGYNFDVDDVEEFLTTT